MKSFLEKIKQSKLGRWVHRLNQHPFMPLIWWAILSVILWFGCGLVHLPKVWRIGLIFMLYNGWLSYHLGHLIAVRKLSKWWILLLPAVFAAAVALHFAKYNFVLCAAYLILAVFGLWQDNFYKEAR
ncbi:MAG: hypothetical protein LKG31_01185 [Lactobacillus sp.]|jgi:hypothetical protein|nr:hypothetical protein [Lactobacillus sp.]